MVKPSAVARALHIIQKLYGLSIDYATEFKRTVHSPTWTFEGGPLHSIFKTNQGGCIYVENGGLKITICEEGLVQIVQGDDFLYIPRDYKPTYSDNIDFILQCKHIISAINEADASL